ncbi:hypothetical protein IQ07DRAFT_608279 [Pyrenochaeta sp. DS3sAY3a]|nr:hypothetical protein IQ07DRAFT_608279 [Pyrenochaeta sp. DS3sAY3a]
MYTSSTIWSNSIEIRIQPRGGFTRHLLQISKDRSHVSALIEGPYGRSLDLQDFGTVVMFASGIGIVGHLQYLKKLVADSKRSATKVRDLLLVWFIDREEQRDLVADAMDHLLGEDKPVCRDDLDMEKTEKLKRRIEGTNQPDRPGVRPSLGGANIIDVYIYGYHELLNEDGRSVLQKRDGCRTAEIRGEPDIPQIIQDCVRMHI